jgi:hypothetical protein
LAGQTGDDLVLHAEEVGQGFVETLGPQVTAALGVDPQQKKLRQRRLKPSKRSLEMRRLRPPWHHPLLA